jgi:hypothetical protein
MNARDTYSGRFLRVTDLKARRVPTRIQEVRKEEFKQDDGKTEQKLIVTLKGFEKPLVLNRTNCDTIIDLVGSEETDDWIGKPIVLLQAKVRFQGKSTPCIRVEEPGDATGYGGELPMHEGAEVQS